MNIDRIRLTELITLARDRRASDLHAGSGETPALRIDGRITIVEVPPIPDTALEAFLAELLSEHALARWRAGSAVDLARRDGPGAPYRLHAFRTMRGIRLAFRFHASAVPALDSLELPPYIATVANRAAGLVIFTGPTGSGKTTALAALIDRINRSCERVILTVEDPIEFVHEPIRSTIAQCEIGREVATYAEAVHGFMRADPDVILIGEMRDRATMEAALTAAETGHLVCSTIHTNDAAQTIDRIIDAFPPEAQTQVRAQLAATLLAIVSLRLVPRRDGTGRIAAAEILTGTDAVSALIRDGKTHQLRNAMSTGRAAGMRTLETSLSDHAVRGVISIDVARAYANRPTEVRDLDRTAV